MKSFFLTLHDPGSENDLVTRGGQIVPTPYLTWFQDSLAKFAYVISKYYKNTQF